MKSYKNLRTFNDIVTLTKSLGFHTTIQPCEKSVPQR